jgi:CheY-like chemotaxis protein
MARILIVEDNQANLSLMEYLLNAKGHDVLGAETGTDGIDAALEAVPDVVLMDIELPDMDGLEAADAIRANGSRSAPIVAITAFAMVGDGDRILDAGFDGYIAKPISPRSFAVEVEAYVSARVHPSIRGSQ